MDTMFNINQVAFMLKVHPLTIRRYIREGKLTAVKLGGNVRIKEIDLNKFTKDFTPKIQSSVFKKIDNSIAKIFTSDDPLLQMEGRGAGFINQT